MIFNGRLPVVIMDNTSQNISSSYEPSFVSGWSRYWEMLSQALVWTGMIVIFDILFKHPMKVVFIEYKDAIETLLTN